MSSFEESPLLFSSIHCVIVVLQVKSLYQNAREKKAFYMCFWYFSIPFFASLYFFSLLFIIISHSILFTSFLSSPILYDKNNKGKCVL